MKWGSEFNSFEGCCNACKSMCSCALRRMGRVLCDAWFSFFKVGIVRVVDLNLVRFAALHSSFLTLRDVLIYLNNFVGT